jgi:hypothetical protein
MALDDEIDSLGQTGDMMKGNPCLEQGRHVFFGDGYGMIQPLDKCACGETLWQDTDEYKSRTATFAPRILAQRELDAEARELLDLVTFPRTDWEDGFLRSMNERRQEGKPFTRKMVYKLRDMAAERL